MGFIGRLGILKSKFTFFLLLLLSHLRIYTQKILSQLDIHNYNN